MIGRTVGQEHLQTTAKGEQPVQSWPISEVSCLAWPKPVQTYGMTTSRFLEPSSTTLGFGLLNFQGLACTSCGSSAVALIWPA